MDQLVYNCLLYNPMGSYVRSLGQKIEQRWQDNWRRNPLLNQFQVGLAPSLPSVAASGPGAQAQVIGLYMLAGCCSARCCQRKANSR